MTFHFDFDFDFDIRNTVGRSHGRVRVLLPSCLPVVANLQAPARRRKKTPLLRVPRRITL